MYSVIASPRNSLVRTKPMTDVTNLSEIDGSETRVTVEARVATQRPLSHPNLKQKGALRDGSQNCAVEDAVHFLLESNAAQPPLKVNRTYKIKNARTNYVTGNYTWAPQVQIVIDDKSTVTTDNDSTPDYDKPTTHNPDRSSASNPLTRKTLDSDLTKDLKLNNGGI